MHTYTATATRLPVLTDKLQRKIKSSGLDATSRYELSTRIESLTKHSKLCHGDFNPSNIIITAKNEAYILDWSHASQGNASADAVQTWLLFYLAQKREFADKYLALFCQKTDTAIQYVSKWIPIVAASQIAKASPADQELLLKWASVVEYE
jgi:thiamine kinase-like enzyme